MNTIFYVLPASLTLLVTTATAQHTVDSDHAAVTSMAEATKSLEALKGKEFEVAFLREMIGHHRSALEMAKLVHAHTQHPELNELATNIIAEQKKQITEMSGWLQAWYGQKADEAVMPMPGMDGFAAAKDAEFDKQFVTLMAEHHQGALEMARLVAARAEHAELKDLAAQIIEAQTQEINELNGWKQAWF